MAWSIFLWGGSLLGKVSGNTSANSLTMASSSGVLGSSSGVVSNSAAQTANNSSSGGVLASCCLEMKTEWHSGSVVLFLLALTLIMRDPY